jgi:hypothetical protein
VRASTSDAISTRIHVVSSDRELVPVPVSDGPLDERITLRGASPFYLVVEATPVPQKPGFQPTTPPAERYEIDALLE